MKKIAQHIIVAGFSILITGCVGYINATNTLKTNTTCDKHNDSCWSSLSSANSSSLNIIFANSAVKKSPTKEDVLLELGQPHSIIKAENRETWDYRHDVAWRGFYPILILPIPLLIPVGFNHWELSFNENNLSSITTEKGYGKICVLFVYCPDK